MNRLLALGALSVVLSLAPVAAEGAGGVEVTQSISLPGTLHSTLAISGVGGFGYGVLDNGSVVGGFGMGVHTPERSAGYGGTLQGWQHRWGPLVGLVTTKIGFGGEVVGEQAGFSMLGAAEAQMGVLVFPWFNVGFKAGVMGTATFFIDEEIRYEWTPTVGLRFSWGAF